MTKTLKKYPYSKALEIVVQKNHAIKVIYSQKDSAKKANLVFVHGTPGSATAFLEYHKDTLLLEKYNIISYDRPGYGNKDEYKSLTSIALQAEVLNEILIQLKAENVTLFAHSFGGAIALETAWLNPEKIKKIILVAVAVDPENEKYFWFGKLGKWKMTKWMLPKALETAGDEKYSHVKELRYLKPKLNNIKQKTLIIHGTSDMIVPYANVTFLQKELIHANLKIITLEKENHFIPFVMPIRCRDWILGI